MRYLAQANIARQRTPLDSPVMGEFVAALDPVNRIAEQRPGFVWRLRSSEAHGPSAQAFTLRRRFEADGRPARRRGRGGA
jgi:hypothetical protein